MDGLEAGIAGIRESPADVGRVELIVRRPAVGEREIIEEGLLDCDGGLAGDSWLARGPAHLDGQLTLMNARVAALVAGPPQRWALAGDQLYVDLDLSAANLPTGTRLAVGSALIEVTAEPHTGCRKFTQRFGLDATRLVNSTAGKALRLRGINTRVIAPGRVRVGDTIAKA